jgi:hypothetical protein
MNGPGTSEGGDRFANLSKELLRLFAGCMIIILPVRKSLRLNIETSRGSCAAAQSKKKDYGRLG